MQSGKANSKLIVRPSIQPKADHEETWSSRSKVSCEAPVSQIKTINQIKIFHKWSSHFYKVCRYYVKKNRHLTLKYNKIISRPRLSRLSIEVSLSLEKLNLTTAYLNALASLYQTRDKTISHYMHCTTLIVFKVHPDIPHAAQKRILISSLFSDSTTANLQFLTPW